MPAFHAAHCKFWSTHAPLGTGTTGTPGAAEMSGASRIDELRSENFASKPVGTAPLDIPDSIPRMAPSGTDAGTEANTTMLPALNTKLTAPTGTFSC